MELLEEIEGKYTLEELYGQGDIETTVTPPSVQTLKEITEEDFDNVVESLDIETLKIVTEWLS